MSGLEQILILTGLSGSGKSYAGRCLEDMGYFCVDNLPSQLAPVFAELVRQTRSGITRAALVIDIREGTFLDKFSQTLEDLRRQVPTVRIVFFEARDEVLMRRFSETRRPHPLAGSLPLPEAISREREILSGLRECADLILDTSERNVHELKRYLYDRFSPRGEAESLRVSVLSFGYRHGVPQDADLVFDVRFLPNPNFIDTLREHDGRDTEIRQFLEEKQEYGEFLHHLEELLGFLLPRYVREGKSYLTIAVGCTGGRHRSVAVAEKLQVFVRQNQLRVDILHRDLGRP
ncbi:MAG: RNase adapter RapZ [Acidobacteriota bacterium]